MFCSIRIIITKYDVTFAIKGFLTPNSPFVATPLTSGAYDVSYTQSK